MIQNKKLKRNATYTIAEVAEVALCASNCALPTSGFDHILIAMILDLVIIISSHFKVNLVHYACSSEDSELFQNSNVSKLSVLCIILSFIFYFCNSFINN